MGVQLHAFKWETIKALKRVGGSYKATELNWTASTYCSLVPFSSDTSYTHL